MRQTVAILMIIGGLWLSFYSISNRKILWRTWSKPDPFVVRCGVYPNDTGTPVLINKDTYKLGPVTIEKQLSSGDYQLQDSNKTISIISFCNPFPEFAEGEVLTIYYKERGDSSLRCKDLAYATPDKLQEHKLYYRYKPSVVDCPNGSQLTDYNNLRDTVWECL